MESKSIYYEGYSLSPLDVFEWIKNGAFEYIKAKNELGETLFEECRVIFEKRFAVNFPKVESLIKNDLDRGHVSFVLLVASLYEAFLEIGFSDKTALLWTEESINAPTYSFVAEGTERMLDTASNPFEALVASSKMREQSYFGDSFDFERPIDDDFGYVLHIKKCLFYETLKHLNKTELQPLICRIDLGWINGIKPQKHGLRFVRPVTFASGTTCQMWFVKEDLTIPNIVQ